MKVRVTIINYYEYETEGTSVDKCVENAVDKFNSTPKYEVAHCELKYKILEYNGEEEKHSVLDNF